MCKRTREELYELIMQLMESVNRLDASVRALTDVLTETVEVYVEDGE